MPPPAPHPLSLTCEIKSASTHAHIHACTLGFRHSYLIHLLPSPTALLPRHTPPPPLAPGHFLPRCVPTTPCPLSTSSLSRPSCPLAAPPAHADAGPSHGRRQTLPRPRGDPTHPRPPPCTAAPAPVHSCARTCLPASGRACRASVCPGGGGRRSHSMPAPETASLRRAPCVRRRGSGRRRGGRRWTIAG